MPAIPLLLRPDSFTPATRTPWGGTGIVQQYKRFLLDHGFAADTPVGESWELSLGPEFPSTTDGGRPLSACVADDPAAYLGREAERGGTALLVKWVDAADDLSVQIHPRDDYPGLGEHEGGKPECWYVVSHQPGAGLYVGLQEGVDREVMRHALAAGEDVSKLLRFHTVAQGDFFVLDPGTPHAIGQGVMLIEPQFVAPGRKGITYRYWDWNRRYDEQGRKCLSGQPRELHVAQALEVTDFERAADGAHCDSRWLRAGAPNVTAAAALTPLCGPSPADPIASEYLQVARVAGTGELPLPAWRALRALTVIEGEVRLADGLRVPAGRTAALPASLGTASLNLRRAHAVLSATL